MSLLQPIQIIFSFSRDVHSKFQDDLEKLNLDVYTQNFHIQSKVMLLLLSLRVISCNSLLG